MDPKKILAEIDAEIERLQKVRELLQPPKGAKGPAKRKVTAPAPPASKARKSRMLSPEARKRISSAQKKRWAPAKSISKTRDPGNGGGTGDGGYGIRSKGGK